MHYCLSYPKMWLMWICSANGTRRASPSVVPFLLQQDGLHLPLQQYPLPQSSPNPLHRFPANCWIDTAGFLRHSVEAQQLWRIKGQPDGQPLPLQSLSTSLLAGGSSGASSSTSTRRYFVLCCSSTLYRTKAKVKIENIFIF